MRIHWKSAESMVIHPPPPSSHVGGAADWRACGVRGAFMISFCRFQLDLCESLVCILMKLWFEIGHGVSM